MELALGDACGLLGCADFGFGTSNDTLPKLGAPKRFRHYRRSRVNKAPRKRTFIMHMTKFTAGLLPRLGGCSAGSLHSRPHFLDFSVSHNDEPETGDDGAGHGRDPHLVSSHRVQFLPRFPVRELAVLIGAAALTPALGTILSTSTVLTAAVASLHLQQQQRLWQQASEHATPHITTQNPVPTSQILPKPQQTSSSSKKRRSPFASAMAAAVQAAPTGPAAKRAHTSTTTAPASPLFTLPVDPTAQHLPFLPTPNLPSNLQLGRQLGSGAHGSVFAATWNAQPVAVKFPNAGNDEPCNTAATTIRREAALLSSLSHPNIITCLNPASTSPLHWDMIIEELMPTGSMHDLLHGANGSATCSTLLPHILQRMGHPTASPTPAVADRIVRIALLRDVAAALQHLHSRDHPVVHRDLKPDNVLLSADGCAKLADFSVAVAEGHDESAADMFGTMQYAAPEDLWRGQAVVGPKADVFSLGCMLWEVLSGQRPWQGLDAAQVMYGVGRNGWRLPVDASWPEDLARLMRGCWATDPALRPAAEHAVRVLDAHLSALVCAVLRPQH